jgi:hypothetical protein
MTINRNIPFGNNFIRANLKTSSHKDTYSPFLYYVNSVSQSSDKLFLGGIPLTVSRTGTYYYCLEVVSESGYTDQGKALSFNGYWFSVLTKSSRNKINFATGNGNAIPNKTYSSIFAGLPLAINSNGEILAHQNTITQFSNFVEISCYGIPISVVRNGKNWYLVV